jgi:hypothetical protein
MRPKKPDSLSVGDDTDEEDVRIDLAVTQRVSSHFANDESIIDRMRMESRRQTTSQKDRGSFYDENDSPVMSDQELSIHPTAFEEMQSKRRVHK